MLDNTKKKIISLLIFIVILRVLGFAYDSVHKNQQSNLVKNSWELFHSDKDNFSVLFPEKPKIQSQTISGQEENDYGALFVGNKPTYAVYFFHYDGQEEFDSDHKKALESILKSVLEHAPTSSSVATSTFSKFMGYDALDFYITGGGIETKDKVILIDKPNNKRGIITISVVSKQIIQADYDIFVNSFTLDK